MDGYKTSVAVYLVLTKVEKEETLVLVHKRKNTGYMDGFFDLGVNGFLKESESLKMACSRICKTDLLMDVKTSDIKLLTTYHAQNEGEEYLKFFFTADKFSGEPIAFNNKMADLKWVSIKNLPDNLIWHVRLAFENGLDGINYYDDFEE